MVDHQRLSAVLAQFASNLVRDYSIGDILYDLGEHARELLPVHGAGIMLEAEDGHLRFATATDDRTGVVEELQVQLGEGPCMTAFATGQPVLIPDLQADVRFPRFSEGAVEHGLRAVFALPMTVLTDQRLGAFNLYRSEPGQLDATELDAAAVLADVATAYIVNSRNLASRRALAEQLQRALDSRVIIEQAKGKLSGELGGAPQEAFEVMRRHARTHGRRLTDVARDVMDGSLRLTDLQ